MSVTRSSLVWFPALLTCAVLAMFGCRPPGPGGATVVVVNPTSSPDGSVPVAQNNPRGPNNNSPSGGGNWKTRETVLLSAAEAKQVVPKTFRVSPDGSRFAYALTKSGGQVVVVDGVEQPTVYKHVTDLRFGIDGKDFAINAVVNGSQVVDRQKYDGPMPVVVLNGTRYTPALSLTELYRYAGEQWQFGAPELLAISEGKVLYSCRTSTRPGTDEVFLFVNGEVLAPRERGTAPGWLVAQQKDRLKFARRDIGRTPWLNPPPGFDVIGTDAMFSRDGSAWAAVTREGTDYTVKVNDDPKKTFPSITGLVLSDDGKRYAYLASRPETGKNYYFIGDKLHEKLHEIEASAGMGVGIVFSTDGGHWAVQTAYQVIVDGKPQKAYSAVSTRTVPGVSQPQPTVAFSPDGKHIAYTARQTNRKDAFGRDVYDPRGFLVIDDKEVETWPEVGSEVIWSADNRTVATTARPVPGKPFVVVVNGKPWPQFDQTTPLGFSPDGKTFAAAVRHTEQQFVVFDGKQRGTYEEIGVGDTRTGFTPNGKFTYLARKENNSIVWVEEVRADLPDDGAMKLPPPGSDWQALFNGKDLANWSFPDKSIGNYVGSPPANKVQWLVKEGVLTFTGKDRSYLETAGKDFRRFHLRIEARTSPGARVYLSVGNNYWDSVLVAIDNTGTKQRTGTVALRGKAGNGVEEKLADDGEWFTLEVLSSGNGIATRVNGKKVGEMKFPGMPTGPLQIEVSDDKSPAVAFRKIEYRPLEDEKELDAPGKFTKPEQGAKVPPPPPDPLLIPVEGFTPLFNGKDTTGWVTDRQYKEWEVRNGKLVGVTDAHAIMFTEKEYSDFHLRAVVRTGVGAKGQLLLRANQAQFYQCKYYGVLLDNGATKRSESTGALTREHASWAGGQEPNKVENDKWFLVEIIVQGRRVVTKVNGEPVVDKSHEPVQVGNRIFDEVLRKGRIGLQYNGLSHGVPLEIGRLDIKELK